MKPIIIANWKCNPTTVKEAKKLISSIKINKEAEVVICPPPVYYFLLDKLPKY